MKKYGILLVLLVLSTQAIAEDSDTFAAVVRAAATAKANDADNTFRYGLLPNPKNIHDYCVIVEYRILEYSYADADHEHFLAMLPIWEKLGCAQILYPNGKEGE